MDLLQNRALGVVVEVPYVIRYMLSFKLCNKTLVYDLCFVVLYPVTYLFVEPNNKWPFILQGIHRRDNFFSFSLFFFFFFSVYILLSSMNIVALDDLHGEFSMDLFKTPFSVYCRRGSLSNHCLRTSTRHPVTPGRLWHQGNHMSSVRFNVILS